MSKADGFVVVLPEDVENFLCDLPISQISASVLWLESRTAINRV